MKSRTDRIDFSKTNREWKVNNIISKLDLMEKDLETQKKASKYTCKSLRRIGKQLKSLSRCKQEKFTSSEYYLEGKNKLNAISKTTDRRKSIENMLRLIDTKSPTSSHDFLTTEIVEKQSFKQALRSKKRDFGIPDPLFLSPSQDEGLNYHNMLSTKKSIKALKAILYTTRFIKSPVNQRKFLLEEFSRSNIKSTSPPNSHIFSKPASPVVLRIPERLTYKEPKEHDFELSKEYQETLKKGMMEAGMQRIKLTKMCSVKNALKLAKNIA